MGNSNVYIAAQVDFRSALDAVVQYVTYHEQAEIYCQSMADRLRLAAEIIERRLKEKDEKKEKRPVSVEPQSVPKHEASLLLDHGMNCPGLNPMAEEDCTCGLKWRIQLQTEREMLNAWRKRAEEADKREEVLRSALKRSVVALDDWLNTLVPCFHASDLCDEQRVIEAISRIIDYIADVQKQNRAAFEFPV